MAAALFTASAAAVVASWAMAAVASVSRNTRPREDGIVCGLVSLYLTEEAT